VKKNKSYNKLSKKIKLDSRRKSKRNIQNFLEKNKTTNSKNRLIANSDLSSDGNGDGGFDWNSDDS